MPDSGSDTTKRTVRLKRRKPAKAQKKVHLSNGRKAIAPVGPHRPKGPVRNKG